MQLPLPSITPASGHTGLGCLAFEGLQFRTKIAQSPLHFKRIAITERPFEAFNLGPIEAELPAPPVLGMTTIQFGVNAVCEGCEDQFFVTGTDGDQKIVQE